jgi:hypothetical protein
VPTQHDALAAVDWDEVRLSGDEAIVARASRKAVADDYFVMHYGPSHLRADLDRVPLWPAGQEHVAVRVLCGYYAQYLYLQRVRDAQVILEAVREGVARLTWEIETFAYAESWDESRRRYLGLRTNAQGSVTADAGTLVVQPEAARRQLDTDAVPPDGPARPGGAGGTPSGGGNDAETKTGVPMGAPHRFHASVHLDARRAYRDADAVITEVLQHITALPGAEVDVVLEIDAHVPAGVPENVVRTIAENSRALGFDSAEFEHD